MTTTTKLTYPCQCMSFELSARVVGWYCGGVVVIHCLHIFLIFEKNNNKEKNHNNLNKNSNDKYKLKQL